MHLCLPSQYSFWAPTAALLPVPAPAPNLDLTLGPLKGPSERSGESDRGHGEGHSHTLGSRIYSAKQSAGLNGKLLLPST